MKKKNDNNQQKINMNSTNIELSWQEKLDNYIEEMDKHINNINNKDKNKDREIENVVE